MKPGVFDVKIFDEAAFILLLLTTKRDAGEVRQARQAQRQQMRLRGEDKVVNLQRQIFGAAEQQVEVFERFRQDKRVHLVFVLARSDVLHGGVAARNAGIALQTRHHFGASL